MNFTSAGKGDPYWYEWTVGLLKVVEMLKPESGIKSVSFQVTGAKGWDDVVVRYEDSRTDYIQVKHSRAGRNITFGDLVGTDDNGQSLLGDLYSAWREMKLSSETDKCILFTNRAAGESSGRSDAGVVRPPLLDFVAWLVGESEKAKTLREYNPQREWADAWKEWLDQLKNGIQSEKLSFLRSFAVLVNQGDLSQLETAIIENLADTFQIPPARAHPLLHSLDHALRSWTTKNETVTAEDAYTAMAIDTDTEIEHRAPPPPSPFFPSRRVALAHLESALADPKGSTVLFLSAEPGAGKTSLISELSNRRAAGPFQGLVGLRYFAFRPITPQSPLIPPDADHFVRPDRLWFSLLSQLRQGLKGKLQIYQVPLRNNLISWPEARTHVLRIAEQLGIEMARPFVIIIDGIDHAARAARYEGSHAKDFFGSLPGPDEIGARPIRLMLAGQPPEAYPEYPPWLSASHPRIQILNIGKLDNNDIRILLSTFGTLIPNEQEGAAIKTIEIATSGNTLAAVFAVEEARTCNSVGQLQSRLASRHLQDGLQEYYKVIWNYALKKLNNAPFGTDIALSSALCLTPERLTGELMSLAFQQLGLSAEQWQMLLGSLGPLLVEEPTGFRVLHNDIRVYLHSNLSAQTPAVRRKGAGMLADYYKNKSSNRWFAHKSLLRLLRDAGREVEWATVFSVDWVFEAAALDIPYTTISFDCAEALRQGVVLKNWDVMLDLVCAAETLQRWQEVCELDENRGQSNGNKSAPTFLATELSVRPLSDWKTVDLHNLIRDTKQLIECGESARARSLLGRWLSGLSIKDLCKFTRGLLEPKPKRGKGQVGLTVGAVKILESLGGVCRTVNFDLKSQKINRDVEHAAQAHYEVGWVKASCSLGPFDSLSSCLANRSLGYLPGYETALVQLASDAHWASLRELMASFAKNKHRLPNTLRVQSAWWAIRSGAEADDKGWLDILGNQHFGLSENSSRDLAPALAVCQALSWKDGAAEPSTISERVYDALRLEPRRESAFQHYKLLFRTASTISRAKSVLFRKGAEAAKDILPASEIARFLTALWNYNFHQHNAFDDRWHASRFALDLIDLGLQLGKEYHQPLLKAAMPIAETFPVDFRRESVWTILLRTGAVVTLRSWLRTWLGVGGRLWKDDANSKQIIADELLPLARELGEDQLADRTEDRLRWLQITYRGHKEYVFSAPVSWFGELRRIEPTSWRDLGLRIWTLSEACADLGGDNEYSWKLNTELGAAAWACGPTDIYRLFTADYPRGRGEYWLFPVAKRIIGGLIGYLAEKPPLSCRDKITGWCLAVGLSRWHNSNSISDLAELRTALILSTSGTAEMNSLTETIERISPGEAMRNPKDDLSESGSPLQDTEDTDLPSWLGRIKQGEEVSPRVAASLLGHALSEQPERFNQLAAEILQAVGVGSIHDWSFHSHGNYKGIIEIATIVSDEALWNLVIAAVKYAGSDETWWAQAVSRNLYHVLLCRASKHGASALRAGLGQILKMHERWARGGREELELPSIKLSSSKDIQSFESMAAECLTFMLASRSAELVASTLVGIHTLVNHEPDIIPQLLELANDGLWKTHWILNCAELWATRASAELDRAHSRLECWRTSGPLHLRIQAWLVLRKLAIILNKPLPEFPNPPFESADDQAIITPPREFLETPTTQHGSIRLSDINQSANTSIKRVELATSTDLSEVRSRATRKLLETKREEFSSEPWPAHLRCSGDMRCGSLEGTLVLDWAFDAFLSHSPLPPELQCRFAQAYLDSEDSWVLRATPLPDSDLSAWPTEEELTDRDSKPADLRVIRNKLYLLATQHRVPEDEIVLAAKIQVYTWCKDYCFEFWWEEGSNETSDISSSACPATISGRTFIFSFGDWFEQRVSRGKRPLVFVAGGHQRLPLSFPEFLPAMMWRTEFGWLPSLGNPLIWERDGRPVARYESLHSETRFAHSGHYRQPVLGRWLVKRTDWDLLCRSNGPFHSRDDLARFSSDIES